MRKTLIFCDRCGKQMKEQIQSLVGTDAIFGWTNMPDLCEDCKIEYRKFMESGKK